MNGIRYERAFLVSCAVILIAAGMAKLYSATGTAEILQLRDEVLLVKNLHLMLIVGCLELLAGAFLLKSRNPIKSAFLIAWIGVTFFIYRGAANILGTARCPCLGTLTEALPVSEHGVDNILRGMLVWMILGSAWVIYSRIAGSRRMMGHAEIQSGAGAC